MRCVMTYAVWWHLSPSKQFLATLGGDYPSPSSLHTTLSCPVLYCTVLSCPILSYPILSYPKSFKPLKSQASYIVSCREIVLSFEDHFFHLNHFLQVFFFFMYRSLPPWRDIPAAVCPPKHPLNTPIRSSRAVLSTWYWGAMSWWLYMRCTELTSALPPSRSEQWPL
jgi:hypothetical protein